jgi:large subunit ribosomal protein L27
MAHTKSQKAASGNRDSRSKRLGVKVFGGGKVKPGYIIIRQKGTKVRAGEGTMLSSDFTIVALVAGTVHFKKRLGRQYVYVKN